MIGIRHRATVLVWWSALIGGGATALAQGPNNDLETQVKAGYLGNFGLYVQWPKGAAGGDDESFYVGVLGHDAVVPYLQQIAAKKSIHNRKIVVRHFATIDDYKPCHILFIPAKPAGKNGDSAEQRLAAAKKKTNGSPVLLVGESDGLGQKGAALNLYLDGTNVKFEVNLEAAKAEGLQIRSQLIQLGKIVQPTP